MKNLLFFLIAVISVYNGRSQITLNEGFEGSLFPPEDWTSLNLSATSAWERYTSDSPLGTASASVNWAFGGHENWLITPKLNVSTGLDTISFWIKTPNYHSGTTFEVHISSTTNDINSFDTNSKLTLIDNNITTIWTKYSIPLSNYIGQDIYVGFRVIDQFGMRIMLDNVTGPNIYLPSCAKPKNINITNISLTSADISWTLGKPSDLVWRIYYSVSGSNIWDSVYAVTNPCTINGLSPSTLYDIYLRTDCGTELSEPSTLGSFMTNCGIITSLPWIDNFNNYGTGSTSFPTCWTKNTNNSYYPYIANSLTSSMMYFYSTSLTYNIAATPQFDISFPVNSLQASFALRKTSAEYNLIVGVMTDPTQASTFTPIDTLSPSLINTWEYFDVNFISYTGSGQHIAFKSERFTSNYIQLDNLMVYSRPTCSRPNKPIITNPTLTSLDISWDDLNPNNTIYNLYYRLLGSETWNIINNVTSPTTITGLSNSSLYEIAISTNCITEESNLSHSAIGRTTCGIITALPWSENFDTYGLQSFPTCWKKNISAGLSYLIYTTTDIGGFTDNCLNFYSGTAGTYAIAITPPFDPSIQLNTLKLNFKFKSYFAKDDTLKIGIMTDTSLASFVEVAKVFGPTSWEDYQVDLSSYTGSGSYIGFMAKYSSTYCYANLDDLVISTNVTCPSPTNVVTNNITRSSADISWVAGASETSWQIRNGLSGNVLNLTNTQYKPIGLTPNTSYTFYIRSDCGNGTYSSWAKANFTTLNVFPPNVTTDTVIMNTNEFSAVFQGTTSQGTDSIIARGFEYKKLTEDWSNSIDLKATDSTNINATATGLSAVKYQVRAYAETLEDGKTYGQVLDFNMNSSISSINFDDLYVNLYPNPASSEATLSIKGINGKVKISITDVQGRSISTIERESSNGEVNHSINLEAYAKGVYYIRIQSESSIKTQKLIVQ